MEVSEAKKYLRVDFEDDDALIASLLAASDKYLENAGVKDKSNELYGLAQKMLVSHWYENRQAAISGQVSHAVEFALSSLIFQLKWCYPAGDTT